MEQSNEIGEDYGETPTEEERSKRCIQGNNTVT